MVCLVGGPAYFLKLGEFAAAGVYRRGLPPFLEIEAKIPTLLQPGFLISVVAPLQAGLFASASNRL